MEIVYRAAVIYLFLFLVMRVLGKKELGQMSAFELVLLLAIGDLVQQGVTQEDYSVTGAMLAIGTFACLILLGSFVSYRFPRTRHVLEGRPVVVIEHGRLREDVMRLERVTDSEVREALREQGIDDLAKVRVGLLEADGKFAFLTGSDHEPAPEKSAS
ncbi:MAG: YetF domain-containing protein [Mycobacteriales bacterium]